ncbi:SMI1/KNR4 family protein [Pseudoduganella buxea]|uniref:SMI1/KNR4 family protein n=1 Tax=Pseudoduganella buxea TaxID=1949069 RepID=A0A6I3SZC6_9BURK|nr:SMI1/KNR4 family protein [Pseudoduganella buxea]MTV54533.1 SMI1/KNR4 family protein [Pseudoduganella buxea]GGB82948.1 hypothetical protein GCM10011572_01090 [Pseudoduganella buxea]
MAFDVSEQFVRATELALGATLPAAYRNAMMASNGGTVDAAGDDWALCPIRDTSDRKRLARSANDIVTETARCREWRGFPLDAAVIAQNGAGDCLVLRRAGNVFLPAAWIWRHEDAALAPVGADVSALDRHA